MTWSSPQRASIDEPIVHITDGSRVEPRSHKGVEARRLKRVAELAVIVVVLATALSLRLVGIDSDRPQVFHPDERYIANPAMEMVGRGDWNPRLYLYPSGLLYAERILVSVIHGLTGAPLETGADAGVGGLPTRSPGDVRDGQYSYYLAGRILVAVLGTLTIAVVYVTARYLTGPAGGIAAAAALAVMPLHVAHSHYLTTDVPTGLAIAAAVWLAVEGVGRSARYLVAAGAAAGVAASFKYNGGFVLFVPLVAQFAATFPARRLAALVRSSALIVLAAAAAFVVVTPAIGFDTDAVLGAIVFQFEHYRTGHPGAEGSNNWIHYVNYLRAVGAGEWMMALALIGAVLVVVRRRAVELGILGAALIYFVIVSLPVVRFERNLVPLLPFIALGVGIAVGSAVSAVRIRFGWGAAVVTLAVASLGLVDPAGVAIAANDRLVLPDTRTEAAIRIEQIIPAGSAIVREDFTPQLPPTKYQVGYVWLLSEHPLDWYREQSIDYLVTSSAQFDRFAGYPEERFYEDVLALPTVLDVRPGEGIKGPRIVVVKLSTP